MVSVVLTTYKEPEALDLCLKSCIEGQLNNNEIIVVVDGFYDINKEVLEKYKDSINILNLEENVGMIRAMNLGHYNASNDLVFHIQDDNVFPLHWDEFLQKHYQPNSVLTPNQIEPTPSMFRQFNIKDLGRDPKTFDLTKFWEYGLNVSTDKVEETGSTFPFLINKNDYLKVGGFDESYPGPWVVDWEFFMKCKMSGMKMLRAYNCHFYHFVSLGTRTPEKVAQNQQIEQSCHEYFYYKWGKQPHHDPVDNSKRLF
jgi:glycosyltransferase involved in cell wall biosynthesis